MKDPAMRKVFGNEASTFEALSRFEFCLEFNSFISFPELSPETGNPIKQKNPEILFDYRPEFLAFSLAPVHGLAAALFKEIQLGKSDLLKGILFDPSIAAILTKPGAISTFARFLDQLSAEHGKGFLSQQKFTPMSSAWPKELSDQLKQLRVRQGSDAKS
jgi:hypothetical protein